MSTTAKQSGTDLEVLDAQTPARASQDDNVTHLHFDRQARAWRTHAAIAVETTGADEQPTLELRSA